MVENDEILESMQSDILGLLKNAPKIKGHVLKDNEGDFESRLEKALGTKTAGSTGKRGLAIIVLQVEVTEAEKNLPGPPLQLRARVLVIENIVVNRSVAKGTLQRSSQAALNILSVLHLAGFGGYSIYADKNPIAPQNSPDGISSHIITLFCRVNGLGVLARPLPVQVEVTVPESVAGAIIATWVTGGYGEGVATLEPIGDGTYGTGGVPDPGVLYYYHAVKDAGQWRIDLSVDGSPLDSWPALSAGDESTPDLATWPAGMTVAADGGDGWRFTAPGGIDSGTMIPTASANLFSRDGNITAPLAGDWFMCQLVSTWFVEHWTDGDFVAVWISTGDGSEATPDLAPWPAGVAVAAVVPAGGVSQVIAMTFSGTSNAGEYIQLAYEFQLEAGGAVRGDMESPIGLYDAEGDLDASAQAQMVRGALIYGPGNLNDVFDITVVGPTLYLTRLVSGPDMHAFQMTADPDWGPAVTAQTTVHGEAPDASTLALTCATPAAAIRYTTDGSYPAPTANLYTAPFAVPAAGTVIRAAAYVTGQPPGDVLEFSISENPVPDGAATDGDVILTDADGSILTDP